MRRIMSMQSRFFATLVAAAIATAPLHVAHAAPTVEDLYTQGQEKFDAGEYGDAGDLWGQAVRLLPENKDNSATRQTIMNLALDAYLRAYRADDDRSHIDDAKALLEEYEAALGGAELSSEIASEKGKIEDILTELKAAEDKAAADAAAAAADDDKPVVEDTGSDVLVGNDKPGQGLVIGGGVMIGVGAGGLGLLVAGLVLGGSTQKEFEAAEPGTDERESLRKRGTTMNALAITGGVVAPVFLGAGVALLIIGLRRNSEARSNAMLLPTAGPNYVGLGLSGRF